MRIIPANCPFILLTLVWMASLSGGSPEARAEDQPIPFLKTEHFDRDPGWDNSVNRVKRESKRVARHDFGYQESNHAGEKAGEMGGVVWRSLAPAYYGKMIKPLTFDDAMSCSGTLSLVQTPESIMGFQTGSTIFVGFFNHQVQGWRPVNFLGFRLEGYNQPDGALLEVSYGTSRWTAGGAFVNTSGDSQEKLVRDLDQSQLRRVAPDATKHKWEFRYDPKGADGNGQMIFIFDGSRTVFNLSGEHRRQGATFDRCGIFAASLPGNEMTAYFDDMTINGEREDFSADPGWDGQGNHAEIKDPAAYGENEFGYSTTHGGEMGGRFWRVQEPEYKGYCGDDIGRLTFENKLFARGKMRIPRFCADSGVHFGWFNSKEQGWPPKNFVGVYLDSYTPAGRFATPMYGTSHAGFVENPGGGKRIRSAAHGEPKPLFYPDGRVYDWTLEYDPQANSGGGTITFTLGSETATLNLAPGLKAEGATFDRFGMFNMQDNNGKDCVLYLDDLSYTTAAGDRRGVDAR